MRREENYQDGKPVSRARLAILVGLLDGYFFFPPFFLPLGLAAMLLTPDQFWIHTA